MQNRRNSQMDKNAENNNTCTPTRGLTMHAKRLLKAGVFAALGLGMLIPPLPARASETRNDSVGIFNDCIGSSNKPGDSGDLGGLTLSGLVGGTVIAVSPPSAPAPGSLQFANGVLTVHLNAVPLRQVMAELSAQSGVQVCWLNGGGEELISVEFQHLPVADALCRLLPQQNFLLLYRHTQLEQIWITSAGQGGRLRTLPGTPSPGATVREPATEEGEQPEDEAEAEEDEAELGKLLPQQIAAQVQELVLRSKGSAQRAEAMQWLATQGRDNPQVRAALVQIANDATDPSAQALAAEMLEQQQ
jgi:hypothetical protein